MTGGLQPRRLALISVHTSPLAQPGTGDAGGMNVYVWQTAQRLARRGIEVEIFTRATSSADEPLVQAAPGVLVRNVVAGPFDGLDKRDLPGQLCAFTAGVLRAEAAQAPGYYDLIHSHYWLSGQVGWLTRDRWRVPLVHTAHTLAAVKNAALAEGDTPEPETRVIGEKQVIVYADWPGRSPQDVDDQVTFPLTTSLTGTPGVKTIRSMSGFGFSMVFVIFKDEVDYYWDRLVDGGQESQCGWLKDRFGLSWQIVPRRLTELMSDPDRDRANRAVQAMLQMKKIIVADLEAAAG